MLALLALAAVESGQAREALVWLLAALVIDGVDGTLARHARVSERVPRIDGPALDLVVDYLTYVFVPAWFLWRLGAFPPPVCAAAHRADPAVRALHLCPARHENSRRLLPRLSGAVERRRAVPLVAPRRRRGSPPQSRSPSS